MTLKQFLKHPLREGIGNLKLKFSSINRYYKSPHKIKEAYPPPGYELVFEEGFYGDSIDREKWKTKPDFGPLHPSLENQYYDSEFEFSKIEDQTLLMGLGVKPKGFKKADLPEYLRKDFMPEEFTREVCIGYLETRKAFQYGWFEAKVRLPIGQYLWPAFWLSGVKTWPPEIDIFEGYTEEDFKYRKGNRTGWKIQPNLHYGSEKDGTKDMYGPFNSPVRFSSSIFTHYACWWERDFIRIYYNGFLVFECKNPEVLKHFNLENGMSEQTLILNLAAHINNHPSKIPDLKTFMGVQNVRIFQKK